MRWHDEQRNVERIGIMLGVPSKSVFIIVVLCGGVWKMNKEDFLCMLVAGILIVIVTELFIAAITGTGVIFRGM